METDYTRKYIVLSCTGNLLIYAYVLQIESTTNDYFNYSKFWFMGKEDSSEYKLQGHPYNDTMEINTATIFFESENKEEALDFLKDVYDSKDNVEKFNI